MDTRVRFELTLKTGLANRRLRPLGYRVLNNVALAARVELA